MKPVTRTMPGRRRSGGFTLIELMVACMVVGILSAIAYPSYTKYVLSSNRSTAKAILSEQATYMERYFTSKGNFTDAKAQDAQSPKKGNVRYEISLETTADTFKVKATPKNAQVNDECGTLTIDQTGATATVDAKAGATNCW